MAAVASQGIQGGAQALPPSRTTQNLRIMRNLSSGIVGRSALLTGAVALTALATGAMSVSAGAIVGALVGSAYAVSKIVEVVAFNILEHATFHNPKVQNLFTALRFILMVGAAIGGSILVAHLFGAPLAISTALLFTLQSSGMALALGLGAALITCLILKLMNISRPNMDVSQVQVNGPVFRMYDPNWIDAAKSVAALSAFGSVGYALTALAAGTLSVAGGAIVGATIGAGVGLAMVVNIVAQKVLPEAALNHKAVKVAIALVQLMVIAAAVVGGFMLLGPILGTSLAAVPALILALEAFGMGAALMLGLALLNRAIVEMKEYQQKHRQLHRTQLQQGIELDRMQRVRGALLTHGASIGVADALNLSEELVGAPLEQIALSVVSNPFMR